MEKNIVTPKTANVSILRDSPRGITTTLMAEMMSKLNAPDPTAIHYNAQRAKRLL